MACHAIKCYTEFTEIKSGSLMARLAPWLSLKKSYTQNDIELVNRRATNCLETKFKTREPFDEIISIDSNCTGVSRKRKLQLRPNCNLKT